MDFNEEFKKIKVDSSPAGVLDLIRTHDRFAAVYEATLEYLDRVAPVSGQTNSSHSFLLLDIPYLHGSQEHD